jgi:hypothetical protein
VIAEALGTPLMPWMELVIRVVTERRLDNPHAFRYPIVVLTVPRQSGKTTTMRIVLTQRGIANAGRRSFYTAQTGKDATARWKDMVKAVEKSPLRSFATVRLAAGSQSLSFPNDSSIVPFAPTARSLHGYTPHDVMVDELFDFDDDQGNDLMGAIGPAQLTIVDRQLWLVSTMGHADSTFLHSWIDIGRAATLDPDTQIAYFEWSLPDGLDPEDPANWTFHPALGHTATIERLIELREQHSYGEWMRAFMNRRTSAKESIIDPAVVASRATHQTPPASTSELAIAYESAYDRSRSVIRGAWFDPATGRPATRLLMTAPGTDWVPAAIEQLRVDYNPRAIGADDGGSTRDITDAIHRDYPTMELQVLSAKDFATACDSWKARVLAGTMSHDGDADLLDSADNAASRSFGQGWAWDRVKSRGPIPDIIADTVALRLLDHGAPVMPDPIIRFAQ